MSAEPTPTQAPIKQEAPTAAPAEKKPSWQAERAALIKRMETLEAKLEQQGSSGETQKSIVQSSFEEKPTAQLQTQEPHQDHDHAHEEGKPHFIGPWQKFCPTCGDSNPTFKDEVVCDSCNGNLGAKETAIKLKACPNCGGKKAHVRIK